MTRLAPVLSALALFAGCLFLHTRDNAFPFHYHPDELGKVEQVLTERWNFHHPMLLLTVTKAAVQVLHIGRDEQAVPHEDGGAPQAIVQAGRWVSAVFTALAVVALALLAGLWRGWLAAIAAGGALALHHQLFELSHYMKEDSALLLGMALTFLAASVARTPRPLLSGERLVSRSVRTGRPQDDNGRGRPRYAGLALGVAAGMAISGKYLGVLSLAIALPVLLQRPREERWKQVGVFAAALVVTFAIFNLPLLTHLVAFSESFGREMHLVVKGQSGTTRSVPHAQYWNVFIDNTTPAMWVLLLAFLAARWRQRRELALAEWLIIAFPIVYALALSFSPKSNDRYFLPATAVFTLLAALGAVDVARLFRKPWAAPLAAVLLIGGQVPSLVRYFRAFQHDDNAALIDWLRAARDIPADAVIVKDSRVSLLDPQKKKRGSLLAPVPQKIIAARFAADRGTLEELRAAGVTHAAVSESDYGKFFLRSLRPQKGDEKDFARRRAFYEELLRGDPPLRLIFERRRGTVLYLHPGIRVYRIAPSEDGKDKEDAKDASVGVRR